MWLLLSMSAFPWDSSFPFHPYLVIPPFHVSLTLRLLLSCQPYFGTPPFHVSLTLALLLFMSAWPCDSSFPCQPYFGTPHFHVSLTLGLFLSVSSLYLTTPFQPYLATPPFHCQPYLATPPFHVSLTLGLLHIVLAKLGPWLGDAPTHVLLLHSIMVLQQLANTFIPMVVLNTWVPVSGDTVVVTVSSLCFSIQE